MKFTFGIDKFERVGESHTYKIFVLNAEGTTMEEAFKTVSHLVPEGHRVWYWFSDEVVDDTQS